VLEGLKLDDLLTDGRRITGLRVRGSNGVPLEIPARAVALATGGVGGLYAVTTNPREARGNGLAAAARVGALIADAEFVQFHPTALDIGRDPAPLATEALRGEGATLVNKKGERFMQALHPDAELAPRDIVARGVFAEIAAGHGAFLDVRGVKNFTGHFPTVFATCKSAGIDPAREPMPIAPAAHYHMGGVLTDANGRTSIDGLWAAGEVASTGAHGANRLASNSLLEAIVFAARIAADIKCLMPQSRSGKLPLSLPDLFSPEEAAEEEDGLRALMQANVGVIRNGAGLGGALCELVQIERSARSPDLRNMATAALLIAASAYARTESRGGHFRSDFPKSDPAQAARSFITLADARRVATRASAKAA
jgi:L-aspartate oxidase